MIVLENIFRHMEMGESPYEASDKGGTEVSMAVLAATFTTSIVFFPVTFFQGVSKYNRAAMCGTYVGLVPMLALVMLQFSQQWQASDVFRCAPMLGPAAICAGARQAVLWLLVVPTLVVVAALSVLASGRFSEMPLLLPGILALPVYLLLPNLGGRGVPLSLPTDEAKATARGLSFAGVTLLSLLLAGVANLCWWNGFFWLFIAVESIVVAALYAIMRYRVARARWPSNE